MGGHHQQSGPGQHEISNCPRYGMPILHYCSQYHLTSNTNTCSYWHPPNSKNLRW